MLTNDNTFTMSQIFIEAPIEKIWWYLATTEGWNSYLSDIAVLSTSEGEFQKGDRIELVIGELTNHATCTVADRPFLLTLHDHFQALFPDGTTWDYELHTSFVLELVENMVKVTVTARGFTDDEMLQWVREGTEVGWRQSLFNLKCILELGMDLRNEIFGYPRLGVFNYTATEKQLKQLGLDGLRGGNFMKEVFPNGPAFKAGLRNGDVITHIEGCPVPTYYDLVKELSKYYRKDAQLEVTYYHKGEYCKTFVLLTYDDRFTGLIDPNHLSLQQIAVERRGNNEMERT